MFKKIFLKVLNLILEFPRVNNKKILFESYLGETFSDSPKAIYEELLSQENDYEYIWSLKNKEEIKGAKVVKRNSFKYFYHLATAKVIVNNSRVGNQIKKKNGQIIIQTWHGTPFKRLVNDMEVFKFPKTTKEQYLSGFAKEVEKWDYLVSPNRFSTEKFKSAFKYEGKFLEVGYPRNDELLKNYYDLDTLKNDLNIDKNKKVLLYTPTFRENNFYKNGKYLAEIELDIRLLGKLNPDWIILVRKHYLIKNNFKRTNNIIDVSSYYSLNKLFLVSDVLLTDYSSVMFDFSILNKPIMFYAYDLDEYKNDLRGFYLDYEKDLPGKNYNSTEEISKVLKNIDEYKLETKDSLINFRSRFNEFEMSANSSKKVCEVINLEMVE